jgi:transposase
MTDKRRIYTEECKREAVRLVTDQGDGVAEAARHLGRKARMLGRWTREVEPTMNGAFPGHGRGSRDQEQVYRVREEHRHVRMARDMSQNLLRRAVAPLVRGETWPWPGLVPRWEERPCADGWCVRPRANTWSRGSDLPWVTPWGDPVEETDQAAAPPAQHAHEGGSPEGSGTPIPGNPPPVDPTHRAPLGRGD